MIPKPSNLEKVKFSKSARILQYFAFYGLAWSDIQILIPDLESPWNCTPDDTQIIQFGKGQFYKSTLTICLFRLSLCRYSNSDIRSGFSWEFCICRYIDQSICLRSNFPKAPGFCSILPFMVWPDQIFKFWHQIWNLLKIVLQMIPKQSSA